MSRGAALMVAAGFAAVAVIVAGLFFVRDDDLFFFQDDDAPDAGLLADPERNVSGSNPPGDDSTEGLPEPVTPSHEVAGTKVDAPPGNELPDLTNDPGITPPSAREILLQSFQDRYGHMTTEELRAALVESEKKVSKLQQTLIEDRFQRGAYDVLMMGDPPLLFEPGPNGRLPVQSGRAFTDPATAVSRSHVTHLPFDEYPDFYALLDERDWLKESIGEGD